MRSWFPLTDYDFYAYITSGMIIVAAFDYGFADATLIQQEKWTVVGTVFWAAIAYLVGQISSQLSSPLVEHLIGRTFWSSPTDIILSLRKPRLRELLLSKALGIREYKAFPKALADTVKLKAAKCLNVATVSDGEAIFQTAFPYARSVGDSAARLDTFQNQYGMCRNMVLASLVALVPLVASLRRTGTAQDAWLVVGCFCLGVGMLIRFMKFYSAYSCEVLRTFAKVAP